MRASSTTAASAEHPRIEPSRIERATRPQRRAGLASLALLTLAASCGSAPNTAPGGETPRAAEASSLADAGAPPPDGPRTRFPLLDPPEIALDFALQPVPGAASILVLSQHAGEDLARLRRLDGKTGRLGPLIELPDEHVFGALDSASERFTLLSSNGSALCIATYEHDEARPEARACAEVAPSAVVQLGDRLALLELAGTAPPPSKTTRPAPPKATPPKAAPPKAAPPSARPAKKATATSAGPAKGDKKNPSKTRKDLAAKKKRATHAAPPRPPRGPVELRLRWASLGGAIDAETHPTGLTFVPPIDGLGLLGARARGEGIDLAWYESAPKRKSRGPLGSGRLMAGSLRADGTLDLASRVAVLDADLEYGGLRDHHGPRLAGDDASTVYIDVDAKGQLQATRILPTLGHLAPAPAACAVDPDHLLSPAPAELSLYEKLFGEKPCRVRGQPAREPGLVAWAGERGYFQSKGQLRSIGRADGALRDEPAPLRGHRARLAWGALASDGEGVAFAGDQVLHVDARGVIRALSLPTASDATPDAALDAASDAGAPAPSPAPVDTLRRGALRAPELASDRRHAARIGASFWLARGDLVKVWPAIGAPLSLRGLAPEGVSSLVGGPRAGLLLRVRGGALELHTLDETGLLAPLAQGPLASPVRPGFDACERAAGGALVVGPSAADPAAVVAFAVDAQGHVGRAVPVPLPIEPGDTALRVEPFPGGGGWASDLARHHVVWLDDDAHPLASAPWPRDESVARCLDGRPARTHLPSPTPGRFTRLPELAAPGTCVVGEPRWTSDGHVTWLGSRVNGLDARPELGRVEQALPPALPGGAPTVEPNAAPAPAPVCPADMVSIAGRFCVDRFEAMIADASTLDPISPDYPSTPNLLDFVLAEWSTGRERIGNVHARALPLPFLPRERLGRKIQPLAISRHGARPNGYLTGLVAESACAAAGKRLCTLEEFVMACRGEDDTLFPYGDSYREGACNVFRDDHPAAILHGNASVGHLDPRLNRVSSRGKALFQLGGQSPECRSRWGNDAIYDMVGNVDEWIDEGNGAFAGGFYSRSTRAGCEALITAHPRSYLDYSTGARCCKAAETITP